METFVEDKINDKLDDEGRMRIKKDYIRGIVVKKGESIE